MEPAEVKVRDWCLRHLGDGYIMGATGWICSPARRQQQAAQYPDSAGLILGAGEQWDGKTCWDCAQFVRAACREGGVELVSGATSQWKQSAWAEQGKIEWLPKDRVAVLYREGDGRMQHTGMYLGDGTEADARGTRSGVVSGKASEYPWTHYAIPRWAGEVEEEMEKLYDAVVGGELKAGTHTVNLRGSIGGGTLAEVDAGSTVEVLKEEGEWAQIRWAGITGWMMRKFLISDSSSGEREQDTVTMTMDRAMAEALLRVIQAGLGGGVTNE